MALTDNIESIWRYEWEYLEADAGGRVKMSTHAQHERVIREQLMEFLPIGQEECMRMLAAASGRVGRIAVSGPGSTVLIRPVNYAFDDRTQSVLFRSALGSQLRERLRSGTTAFEIDGEDPVQRTGWSVIIVGEAGEVTDAAEIDRLRDFELEPWAPGLKVHWVRIRPTEISGRRIVRVSDAMLD
jgi:uncharacterized protein